jgi:hypothetical protein
VSRVTKPALRGSFLGALLRALNPIMRVLLDSPLHWPLSRWFAILAWTGRRSGRRYSTPVSYVREGSTAWITTGDTWWRNLQVGAPVEMRVAGRWRSAQGVAVTDRATSRGEHERLFREHPWFRRLSGIPATSTGEPDIHAIDRALEAGRTLVRVDLGP